MAEQESQSPSVEQVTSTEPTLDEVYSQFNVEAESSSFNPQVQHQQPAAQPAAQPQPSPGTEIPDPVLDQNGFKAYLARQGSEYKTALSQLTQAHQRIAVQEIKRREEADIKAAVSHVREKVGEDFDDDFIEVALGQKARKDPKFLAIYQQREKKPDAWKAALSAVGNEMKSKFTFRTDPQLAENVRAAKQSTQSTLTTSERADAGSLQSRLDNAKSQGEWNQIWQQAQSNG